MNIFESVYKYALCEPNKVAIWSRNSSITYRQLYQLLILNKIQAKKNGFHKGDAVIVKTNSQLRFIISILSLMSCECWVIPVAYDITDQEINKLVDKTHAKNYMDAQFYYELEDALDSISIIECDHSETGIFHMTSGSTGEAKLCIRTLDGLECEGLSYIETFSITDKDRYLSGSPLYHSYALGAACFPAIMAGATIYTIDSFVPRQVLKIVEEKEITNLIIVPVMAKTLCECYTTQEYSMQSVRVALVGAGAIGEELFESFYERFGIHLMSNYGSTETGGLISRIDITPFSSIGKVMKGVKVKICNELGERVSEGEEGELFVKSDGMMINYYKNSTEVFDKEGFFPMGDIAIADQEQNYYIIGRKKLLINVGGKKVNPLEVEKAIMEIPGIKECVVVGVTLSEGKEIVKAFIVADQVGQIDIVGFLEGKLTKHKIPSRYEFIDKIPKDKVGKVNRKALMEG